MKKYLAEFFGTMFFVFIGTGTVVLGKGSPLMIALAFGLGISISAYAIGSISGAMVNPAVSLAMYINKRLSLTDTLWYIVAEILGAIAASGLLDLFLGLDKLPKTNFGQNDFTTLSAGGAFVVETVFSFLFIFVILMVTSEKYGNSQMAGFVIGLTLTLLILVGLKLTGVSVNPARSIGPALFAGGTALSHLWVFILAPCVGGILAAWCSKFLFGSED
ncbi:hypothetical protein IV38_GL001854 [Lactobacillus selangorensis]|uniref:Aquaporin n=1 Tax=Lactobacillus selangorensis TaxID=81857 RepID=A0A0R2G0F1_9LACO|nr:aquaporin [Lactobacillus selangorensis]KRN28013.1 hypothetical protein IV38_GL001854 [Lactobacillus selangorensis]KRN30516.1 hypothetical protein IV40_GL001701 [Lactobacillus selangorensis]